MDRLEATGPDPPEVDLAILLSGLLFRGSMTGGNDGTQNLISRGIGLKGPALVTLRLLLRGISLPGGGCAAPHLDDECEGRDPESDLWIGGRDRSSSAAVVVAGNLPPPLFRCSLSEGFLRVTARSLVLTDVTERVTRLWRFLLSVSDAQQRRIPLDLGGTLCRVPVV